MSRKLYTSLNIVIVISLLVGQNAFAKPKEHYVDRTINGKYNNIKKANWGKAGCPLARLTKANYENRKGDMNTDSLPNPRLISNEIFAQKESILNNRNLSDMVWQWGQFLDHDLDLAPENFDEPMPIEVPKGDDIFDPDNLGDSVLTFFRSVSRIGKKTKTRTQMNMVTSYIDASNVYGSDEIRAQILRQLNYKGLMKVSSEDRLPFNLFGLENAGGNDNKDLYLAGDVRANEQIGLVTMHTLFVREHNRKAREIASQNPNLNDEEIYQEAKDYVGALMQQITYNEFLPALLGENSIKPYAGYNKRMPATIMNEFATFAFRFGHSAVSPTIKKIDDEGNDLGDIKIMESFFKPELISDYDSVGCILKGLSYKKMQEIDTQVIDDLRNFLFIDVPDHPMLDLVSLNIQRSRDHGTADINAIRQKFGLTPYTSFSEITSNKSVVEKLEKLYSSIEEIDPFVIALAEDHIEGSSLGETATTILIEQFERLRDGDRFYFEHKLDAKTVAEIKATKLSDVIKRNTQITNIQDNVFFVN
jgi:hypothetical protein